MAFQLRPNESIIPWDYRDSEQTTIYSFYGMKDEFDEGSEIYDILDEVEHKIDFPKISKSKLKQEVINWFDGFGNFVDINLDKDLYLELLEDTNFVEGFIESEINYSTEEFSTDFLPSYDSELDYTFKYIWRNADPHGFVEYFGLKKGIGNGAFWKDEGYPDIDYFIEALEDPETLKKQHYEENTKYDQSDCYAQIEDYLDNRDKKESLVKNYFKNERYDGYTAENLIEEMYGDPHKMTNKKLTDIGANYIGYKDYIKAYVDTLSVDDMFEIAYP